MPNSLLWVCLVAIWLFVLVPMVVKSRPTVRKTTDAAMSTRVLYRGGRAIAKTRRRMAAGRHPHDPDWEPPVREYRKTAKATAATDAVDVEDATTTKVSAGKSEPAPVSVKTVAAAAQTKTVDTSDSDADATTDDKTVVAEAADLKSSDHRDAVAERDDKDADADRDDRRVEDAELDDAELEDADHDDADHDDAENDVDYEDADHEVADHEDADYDDGDYEDADYDDDLTDEDISADEAADQAEQDEVARRARRGGFDPEADRERSDKRYRFRQRVMAVLGVLALLGIAAGFFLGSVGWILAAATVVALVGYLAFLRRAVRNEQRIRRQRMQRLARAKRQEEERRAHPEVDPRAEVPRRLRRPGAIVLEIDDEDPIFDHLPRFEHREEVVREPSYRRVVGQ
ncbi:hypothetical protein DFJ75_3256 [Williamsia muralis]|uniref:Transmembrane protein n=1 Tax=Williamsia marianensis TaxID=85044 RepID=A0A495K548_WILMA|nr:gephyrin-like molybdotransferase receptor GlpR [Williamsia muralis]RKR96407.1 hypothetical protein DFJ75_3256 [Williamsia muralis]